MESGGCRVKIMSEDAESVLSVASYQTSGGEDKIIQRIYRKLAHENEIPTLDHIEAAEALSKLQSSLENRGVASKTSQIRLICVITSLFRRSVRMEENIAQLLHYSADSESPETASKVYKIRAEISDIKQTATLVFITIVMMDTVALGGVPADADTSFQSLDDALDRSLWEQLAKSSKRRLDLPDELQYNEKQKLVIEDICDRPFVTSEESSAWSRMLAQPGLLANSAVRAAGSMLANPTDEAMEEMQRLAQIFSQSTSAQMAVQMLQSERDFFSLASQRIATLGTEQREDALMSVISAAESESGQAVLRDILISFLLPQKEVGKRRTLLLSREVSAKASKSFPWVASIAHEAAMSGAEYIFKHSQSELKKTVALLAGLAIITTKGTDDVIRKATAFGGLVQLPFLETVPPPKRTQQRLALVPTTRSWTLYTLSPTGKPIVEISRRGLEGLILCLLCFRESL